MKVYHSIDSFETISNAVVTTGTFDGVHVGHRKIIQRLNEVAAKNNGESVLLTFHPHPRVVLQPDMELKLLTNLDEKIALLEDAGLDHLIIHPFTREFSRTSSLEFVRNLIVNKIGAKHLVIGYDHHFGRNREGSFDHLVEFGPVYGFDVEEIPAQDIDDVNVSSTKIRNALTEGDVETAHKYLTYPFHVSGWVVKGDQIGHTIGFPTANVEINDVNKLIPTDGVYAVRVKLSDGSVKSGMCNIGHRPTVHGRERRIEVNLFDYSGDLYGEKLVVRFYHRIRAEQKFEGVEALKTQLHKDEVEARRLLDA
ncbi:bifunctional riboflavin kinase/FAD synthetase [Phaeocystidibacter luteus]|uniref:Riboflavin biosynthesis protein n=1 Tax=Phaeocystidibacter luteus TaxID=911197 RepID=A0A6N6RJU4_9FLAO|nr:bifunctional riboflavin kinase/FAD synthetase [Phaeocystidibacter luteus]KAB2814073.1 bifunctional riboflavin kinase/FAD synthetase [Phaeocystidibacter luteus]